MGTAAARRIPLLIDLASCCSQMFAAAGTQSSGAGSAAGSVGHKAWAGLTAHQGRVHRAPARRVSSIPAQKRSPNPGPVPRRAAPTALLLPSCHRPSSSPPTLQLCPCEQIVVGKLRQNARLTPTPICTLQTSFTRRRQLLCHRNGAQPHPIAGHCRRGQEHPGMRKPSAPAAPAARDSAFPHTAIASRWAGGSAPHVLPMCFGRRDDAHMWATWQPAPHTGAGQQGCVRNGGCASGRCSTAGRCPARRWLLPLQSVSQPLPLLPPTQNPLQLGAERNPGPCRFPPAAQDCNVSTWSNVALSPILTFPSDSCCWAGGGHKSSSFSLWFNESFFPSP